MAYYIFKNHAKFVKTFPHLCENGLSCTHAWDDAEVTEERVCVGVVGGKGPWRSGCSFQ